MKLVQGLYHKQTKVFVQQADGLLADLSALGIHNMEDAIARMDDLRGLLGAAGALPQVNAEQVSYLPPVKNPGKIICVGMNYRKHIQEMGASVPDSPVLFAKYANAIMAHNQPLPVADISQMLDYEAELVIIIGKTCRNISQQEARSHCFGYTCGNDLSARDLQFTSSQWMLGKACDHFAPLGPTVVTADAINPDDLAITCHVNGHLRQEGNTGEMLFSPDYLVSYLSQYMTLSPGDLIFTGTPKGVGMAMPEENRKWLASGDVVEVDIEGIGTLTNQITD